jgi:hypothetical protein
MNRWHYYVYGVIAVMILYYGCRNKGIQDMKSYHDSENRISIEYPSAWHIKEVPHSIEDFRNNVIVIFQKPQIEGDRYTNIILSVEHGVEAASVVSYLHNYEHTLKATVENVVIEKRKRLLIDAQECQRIVYTASFDHETLTSDQIFYKHKNTMYVLTLVVDKYAYEKNRDNFEKIVKTFRIQP